MLGGLRLQIVDINVALRVAGHRDDFESRHHGARGVRAVRRYRYQANITPTLAPALVIGVNDQETPVLSLRPGVRLQ